jgi:hypothetical protein
LPNRANPFGIECVPVQFFLTETLYLFKLEQLLSPSLNTLRCSLRPATSLETLGKPPEVIEDILDQVRRRDAERVARQFSAGIMAGRNPLLANSPKPDRP